MTKTTTAAMITAGCATACAGVSIVPALVAGSLAGGLSAAGSGEGGLALAVMALAGGGWWIMTRRDKARRGNSCSCGADADGPDGPTCVMPQDAAPKR